MSNHTKTKKNAKGRIALLISVVAVVVIIILLLFKCCGSDNNASVPSAPDSADSDFGIVYDPGAVEGGWDAVDEDAIVASLNEKVADGMINISMNTTPVFADGESEGNIMIVNEPVNNYPQVVEIVRTDNNETIYKSNAIPVGCKIEKARLSSDLPAGIYECTALFYNVDPNTGNYLGCAGAIIHITVLE